MAASHETQWKQSTTLPLQPLTPVRIVSNLISNLTMKPHGTPTFLTVIPEDGGSLLNTHPLSPSPETPVQHAVHDLTALDAGFLSHNSPIKSMSSLTLLKMTPIFPSKPQNTDLLSALPSSVLEEHLQEVLWESEEKERYWKAHHTTLQSAFVLQEIYCKRIRCQLAQKEGRNQKGKSCRMPGEDGMPQLLTGNDFYTKVVEYEESVSHEEAEKETRCVNKESQANALTKAMEEWKITDKEWQE